MTCDEARQLLHGYIDDELDLATALQIEKHLELCARCRQEVEAMQAVRTAVAQPMLYQRAPSALRERLQQAIRAEIGQAQPADEQLAAGQRATPALAIASPGPSSRRWWSRPMAFSALAAGLLLIVGLVMYWPARAPRGQIADLVGSHVRSLLADHLLDVESTDQHTVKPWFDGKIEFAPPVIDLAGDGFPLLGARLDYLQDHQVAAIVYRHNKHIINLFIWPGNATPETDTVNGYNLIQFECNGMICWAISDLNTAELQQFADLFKAQKSSSTRS